MDSDAGALCATVILLILLLIHFVMAAYAAALAAVPETELEDAVPREEKLHEELIKMKETADRLTHTVWLFGGVTCTAGGILFLVLRGRFPVYAVFLILVTLFYLMGHSLPEMVGRKDPIRYLQRRYAFVHRIMILCMPVTYVLTAVSHFCIRLFGIDPESLEPEVTEDGIISMVNEGHEQGVLDAHEAEMIQNIFELDDKNAGNIMTHRKNIIGISGNINLNNAIAFMVGESVSRFPVYEENIDNILGVLHFKDAMKFHTMGRYDNWLIKDIPELLRPIRFIPETRGIDVLFKNMQAEKLQMVIVVDEYGQTAGLVTMEDILEEIVGSIQDEYDDEAPLIRQVSEDVYQMDGMAPLSEAAAALGITFEDEEYDTLNGLLISKLDRIPSDGEQAEVREKGYLFQILKVEDRIIRLVKITKFNEEEKE